MKKILIAAVLLLLLSACGGEKSTTTVTSNKKDVAANSDKKVTACNLLTQDFIVKLISGVSSIEKKAPTVPKSLIDQNCGYSFKLDGLDYSLRLNLLAANDPYIDEKALDEKVKYIAGSELITDVGEKAYYSSQASVLTAISKQSIVQVTTYSSESKENDKSETIAKKVANEILEALNK